jgi:hypothetical protein
MESEILCPLANDEWTAPELPSPGQRWTVKRKAAIIDSVRGGWVPIEEVVQLYNISIEEFVS